jgi:hypothetical protein
MGSGDVAIPCPLAVFYVKRASRRGASAEPQNRLWYARESARAVPHEGEYGSVVFFQQFSFWLFRGSAIANGGRLRLRWSFL